MNDFIWHNPRCSKSRQTLALLEQAGKTPTVVPYLDQPPSVEELDAACKGLGLQPKEIIRHKEDLFKQLGLSLKDDRSRAEWLQILADNPKLIERPIVRLGQSYVLGRPPENVQALL